MGFEATKWAWKAMIPSARKLVLLVLSDHANDKSLECWPSYRTISSRACCSERTAIRSVSELLRDGMIERLLCSDNANMKRSNVYRLLIVENPECEIQPPPHDLAARSYDNISYQDKNKVSSENKDNSNGGGDTLSEEGVTHCQMHRNHVVEPLIEPAIKPLNEPGVRESANSAKKSSVVAPEAGGQKKFREQAESSEGLRAAWEIAGYTPDFIEFLLAYPQSSHGAVAQASLFWKGTSGKGLDAATVAQIMAALKLFKAHPDWADAQFIPHAAKWLTGGYWQSPPEPVEAAGTGRDADLFKAGPNTIKAGGE